MSGKDCCLDNSISLHENLNYKEEIGKLPIYYYQFPLPSNYFQQKCKILNAYYTVSLFSQNF